MSGTNGGCAGGVIATASRSAGKWYWETTAVRDGGSSDAQCPIVVGVASASKATRLGWYGYLGSFYDASGLSCSGPPSTI
ncbi:MAG: hypothetical protein Q8L86_02930, partial [Vicinamibacterales bacterium]|nr:hypothetical protein [Vicinamibacterales bacterium]